MKLRVSDEDLAPVMVALHDDDGPEALLVQRTGPGWILEFMHPLTPEIRLKIFALGAKPVATEH